MRKELRMICGKEVTLYAPQEVNNTPYHILSYGWMVELDGSLLWCAVSGDPKRYSTKEEALDAMEKAIPEIVADEGEYFNESTKQRGT